MTKREVAAAGIVDIAVVRFQSGIRYRARGTVCPSPPSPSRCPDVLQANTTERLVEAKRLEKTAKMLRLEWDATLEGEIWPGNAHRLPVNVLATATC